jgi:hypothetical protein
LAIFDLARRLWRPVPLLCYGFAWRELRVIRSSNFRRPIQAILDTLSSTITISCLVFTITFRKKLIISSVFSSENFPYFKTAPTGWKNSVRHNLSLNKCFEKIEKPVTNGNQRKGCLWTMNPAKVNKMDEEVQKWSRKDKIGIMKSMVMPGKNTDPISEKTNFL